MGGAAAAKPPAMSHSHGARKPAAIIVPEFATDWGVDSRLLVAGAVAAGFLCVCLCACAIIFCSKRKYSTLEGNAGPAADEETAQEREDILADVYGKNGDAEDDENQDDARLNNAWKALQTHMSSSDEDGEQLIAAEDDLHCEDFFPAGSSSKGASAARGKSGPGLAAFEVDQSPAMLAFGDAELQTGSARPVFGGASSGKRQATDCADLLAS